jgi:hypothetical protein
MKMALEGLTLVNSLESPAIYILGGIAFLELDSAAEGLQ